MAAAVACAESPGKEADIALKLAVAKRTPPRLESESDDDTK